MFESHLKAAAFIFSVPVGALILVCREQKQIYQSSIAMYSGKLEE
jgi:hypothetical protein